MSFELVTATKRNPAETTATSGGRRSSVYTSIRIAGIFDSEASEAVLRCVSESFASGSESVLVDIDEIASYENACIEAFGASVMSLRNCGKHIQVNARSSDVHSKLGALPDSRDWLLQNSGVEPDAPRRALHLDGPR